MEVSYLGNTSVRLAARNVTIVTDPAAGAGKKSSADVTLVTHGTTSVGAGLVIDGPGEYEVRGSMITGIPVGNDTAYVIHGENTSAGILTNVTDELAGAGLEQLSELDVLFINAAGHELIGKLEPKYVVPLGEGEVLQKFLDEMGATAIEPQAKLKISGRDVPEETTVVRLTQSA